MQFKKNKIVAVVVLYLAVAVVAPPGAPRFLAERGARSSYTILEAELLRLTLQKNKQQPLSAQPVNYG